jgi:hypothetical protein
MGDESLPKRTTAQILLGMAAVQLFVAATAVLLTVRYHSLAPFAVAVPVVGITAFTGVYLDTHRIRHAVAAAVIIVYFTMMGFALNSALSDQVAANQFLHDLYDDFRTLVTTIVAFYFTSDVAERIVQARVPDATPTNDSAPRAETSA